MIELLKEILASVRHNKLRTALTGFSVAWGIFMLIILLGAGNGLKNGMTSNYKHRSDNSVTVYPGYTQLAYQGYNQNRKIRLKYDDAEYLEQNISSIEDVSSVRYSSGNIAYKEENTHSNINGVTSLVYKIENFSIEKGRYINETDLIQKRKVVVLTKYTAGVLFDKEEPINKLITIDGIGYTVVGIVDKQYSNYPNVFIPITTSLAIYNTKKSDEISRFVIETRGVHTMEQNDELEQQIRETLAVKHQFSKQDKGGLWLSSSIARFIETELIFNGITMFIWIIGLGTLMAGIVGVSNIMLVTVRERTNEFGIRKSMGATPASLVRLVLIEAVSITMIFGYIGMVGGTFTMEGVNFFMENFMEVAEEGSPVVFKNPTIDIRIALYATIVLIIAGTIAGYIPARRAARLKTIDAMRYNK